MPTRVPRAIEIPRGPMKAVARAAPPDRPVVWPTARSVSVLVILMMLLSGVAYPGAVRLVADLVAPTSFGGSTITLGQNITDPGLFWLRPSMIDYAAFAGAGSEVPYGPLDPALLNQTRAYIAEYGLTNVTVPANLVTPSESGLDPDILPEAALVQIPRIAHVTNLTQADLVALVDRFITEPALGIFGPEYVNVIQLDQALLGIEGRTTATVLGG
ncbi:MAG: potassium-transporting ATPase subunit C [Thermoplasmata archaeon]|nr:potassium-transporting ATPase subunit C [Thermoplasmata archaeon]